MIGFILFSLVFAENSFIRPVHKPLQVTVGGEIFVDLEENPTTGFTWQLFDDTYTTGGFLSFVSDSRVESLETAVVDGAPSVHRFVFHGEKSGATRVRFVQARFGVVDAEAKPETYFVRVVEKADTGMIRPVHKPLEVVVGNEIVIDLEENPTTGYTWKFADNSYTASGFLSFVSDSVVEGESAKGAPSVHRFVFRGEKSGTSRVSFVQARFGVVDVEVKPESYYIRVVEKADTGMIRPDGGRIHPVHKPLEVVVGNEVVIDLEENPTTGYTWKFSDDSYTAGGFLSFVSDSVVEGESAKGAPSVHRFVFRGDKSGSSRVRFVQARFGVVDAEAKPETYYIRVVEKADTGMISPDGGRINPVHKPLEVIVGSEVVIDLPENPSTGHIWSLLNDGYATDGLLSFVRDETLKMDGDDGKIVGKSTIHRFVFRGEKYGFAKVSFGQGRLGKDLPMVYFVHVVEKAVPL